MTSLHPQNCKSNPVVIYRQWMITDPWRVFLDEKWVKENRGQAQFLIKYLSFIKTFIYVDNLCNDLYCIPRQTLLEDLPWNSPYNNNNCESWYTKTRYGIQEKLKHSKIWVLRTPVGSLRSLCWRYFSFGWIYFLLVFALKKNSLRSTDIYILCICNIHIYYIYIVLWLCFVFLVYEKFIAFL